MKKIELKDIQVGDTIRAVWNEDEVCTTREGVVNNLDEDGDARTGDYLSRGYITYDMSGGCGRAEEIYLIHRPTLPVKEAMFWFKGGSAFYLVEDGIIYISLEQSTSQWRKAAYTMTEFINHLSKGIIVPVP